MKKIITSLCVVLIASGLMAQTKKQDTVAILIMDRMADMIGDMESCSFKLTVANDAAGSSKGFIKYFSEYEVYMGGPDKMMINAHDNKGHRQLWYNGNQLAYYSFDENNYGVVPTPNNLLSMIDSVHKKYDVEFPAADFFYPTFTDDLLHFSDSLRFLGMESIGAKEFFHVIAYAKEMDAQFWINNDAYNLPARFAITYKTKPGNPQYLAMFSDWEINPHLPTAMFEFLPPPGAAKVRIMSKSDR